MADADHSDEFAAPQSKACTHCKAVKMLAEYYAGDGRFGRIAKCRTCMREIGAARRRAHPEKAKEHRDRYREKYPERVAASMALHRAANMDRIRDRDRQWRLDNPDKCREISKRQRAKKPEEFSRRAIEWQRRNPEKVRAARERWLKSREDDIGFRLSSSLRAGLSRGVAKGLKRRAKTFDLVGYTLQELKDHLQSRFQPGMSWENYGKWHIDHIVPLAVLGYPGPADENFQQAWALSNLQPLWAEQNLRKHAKVG